MIRTGRPSLYGVAREGVHFAWPEGLKARLAQDAAEAGRSAQDHAVKLLDLLLPGAPLRSDTRQALEGCALLLARLRVRVQELREAQGSGEEVDTTCGA